MSRTWSEPVKLCPKHPKREDDRWCRCSGPSVRWRYRMGEPDAITGILGSPRWSRRFHTKKDADEDQATRRAAIVAGTFKRETTITLGEWLDEWMEMRRGVGDKKESTYRGHEAIIRNWLKPALGDVKLKALTPSMVQKALSKMAKSEPRRGSGEHPSPGTLLNIRSCLHKALDAAVIHERMSRNPVEGIELPKMTRRSRKPLEREQLRRLLLVMDGDHLKSLWLMAIFTGMRRGELCGLRWSDVDLTGEFPVAHVRQQVAGVTGEHACLTCKQLHTGRLFQELKSTTSKRDLPLHPFLVETLQEQRRRVADLMKSWPGEWSEHDLVFPSDGRHGGGDLPGVPWRPDYVGKSFSALLEKSGVVTEERSRPTLHTLRSGLLSLVVEGGASVDLASKVAGHADAETTRKWYLKVSAETTRAALAAVVAGVMLDSSDPGSDPTATVGGSRRPTAEAF